ncbi:MAG: hypothetical protein JSV16_12870, partial [Candidatus Hydrogenedentota bacterium]
MDKKILEFIDALRSSGVRVALSENIDCFHALEILGLEDKPTFRAALRSTLVKRAADVPVFEKLFELYFTSLGRPFASDDDDETDLGMLLFGSITMQEFIDSFLEENRERFPNLFNLFNWQLGGDFELIMMEFGMGAGLSEISNPLQVGFFSRKIRDSMGWNLLAEEIEKLRQELLGE